jgi:hypothetical protein
MTIGDFVLDTLERRLALPSNREWFETLRRRGPVPGVDARREIQRAREARDEQVERRRSR